MSSWFTKLNALAEEMTTKAKESSRASRMEQKEKSKESDSLSSSFKFVKSELIDIREKSGRLLEDVDEVKTQVGSGVRRTESMGVKASIILLENMESKFGELIKDCKEAFTEIDDKVNAVISVVKELQASQLEILKKIETLQVPSRPYFQDRSSASEDIRSGSSSSASLHSGDDFRGGSSRFFRRTSGSDTYQNSKSQLEDLLKYPR